MLRVACVAFVACVLFSMCNTHTSDSVCTCNDFCELSHGIPSTNPFTTTQLRVYSSPRSLPHLLLRPSHDLHGALGPSRAWQIGTTKGTGGDVLILEEAAYCDEGFFVSFAW